MKRSRVDPFPAAPRGLQWTRFSLGGEEMMVLSFESPLPNIPASFTPAERDVLGRVLRGESNGTIASARGRSRSTVAKQVASLFRKLGVRSRAQLVRELSRR